jgi:hypothetical protein
MPASAGSGGGYKPVAPIKGPTTPYTSLAGAPSTYGISSPVATGYSYANAGSSAPAKAPKLPAFGPPMAQKTAAAAVAAGGSNQPHAPADAYQGVSYGDDPILAQVRTIGQAQVPDAIAQADAARKQLLIAYGDPSVANQTIFGGKGFSLPGIAGGPDFTIADTSHTGDQSTAEAAKQNPFSTLMQLQRAHTQQGQNIDNSLNDQGLFFSGTRVKALQDEATNYQQQLANAYSTLLSDMGGIDSQLQGAYQTAGQQQMQAEQDAYLRALAAAAQNPPAASGDGGGSGGSGGGYGGDIVLPTPAASGGSAFAPVTPTSPTSGYLQPVKPSLAPGFYPAPAASTAKPKAKPSTSAYNRATVALLH